MPDIFLYQGEASSGDVRLRDPTVSGAGSTAYTGNVSEAVSLAEATAGLFIAMAGLSETTSLSDITSARTGYIVPTSETDSLSEALAGGIQLTASPSETVTISEATGALSAFISGLSYTATFSDRSVAAYNAITAVSEAPGLSESASALSSFLGQPSESVTLSVAVAGSSPQALTQGIAESVGLSVGVDALHRKPDGRGVSAGAPRRSGYRSSRRR